MYNMFALLILFILYSFIYALDLEKYKLEEFDRKSLLKIEKERQNVFLFFLNKKSFFHKDFLKKINSFLETNRVISYKYGYIDISKNKQLVDYFKIKNYAQPGIVLYNFKNKDFYIAENITKIQQLEDITNQLINKTLDWNGTNMIENIFFIITGKRLGKKAHMFFAFLLCVFGIILYIIVKHIDNKLEREEIQRRFKTK